MTSLPTIHTFAPTGLAAPVNVRTTVINGEPWFVAADVCRALGLRADAAKDARIQPDEFVVVRKVRDLTPLLLGLFRGTDSQLRLLSESGLYKLIPRSDKKEALAFQDWVTREVLPALRKTGSYALADTGHVAMPLPLEISETLAALVTAQQETNRLLGELIAARAKPGVVEKAAGHARSPRLCGSV